MNPELNVVAVSCFRQMEKTCMNVIKIYELTTLREVCVKKIETPKPDGSRRFDRGNIKKLLFARATLPDQPSKPSDLLVAVTDGDFSLHLFRITSRREGNVRLLSLKLLEQVPGVHSRRCC